MKNSKGFALFEMVVVIMIVGILAVVSVPSLVQYVESSREHICQVNRDEFVHSYNTHIASGDGSFTLEQAFSGAYPEMAQESEKLNCPAGGTLSVSNGKIVCSQHHADDDTTVIEAGDVIFGTVPIESWNILCTDTSALPYAGVNVGRGKVYVLNGITYVVKWNDYLSNTDAADFKNNPNGVRFLQRFDSSVTINSSSFIGGNEWSPRLMKGTVFYENGEAYVFLGPDNTQYEALPTTGGYWVKITP